MATGVNSRWASRIIVNGKKLSEARIAANLSLDEVSELLSLNKGTISKYEQGRIQPSEERICRLAELFGTDDFVTVNPMHKGLRQIIWEQVKAENSQGEKQEVKG